MGQLILFLLVALSTKSENSFTGPSVLGRSEIRVKNARRIPGGDGRADFASGRIFCLAKQDLTKERQL